MLGIVLLILKIIGIALLVILGLLLLILLAILFVPVRYKAWGEKHEKIKAEGRVTWLFHILRIKAVFEDGKLKTKGKFLFLNIMNSDEDVEKEWNNEEDLIDLPDEDGDGDGNREKDKKQDAAVRQETARNPKTTVKVETDDDPGAAEKTQAAEEIEAAAEGEAVEKQETTENPVAAEKTEGTERPEGTEETEIPERPEGTEISERPDGHKVGRKKDRKKKKEKDKDTEPRVKDGDEKKTGIVKKVKNLYNIKNDPRAKRFCQTSGQRLKKIVRHIIPRKLKGYLKFGTGDPCSTGKILGAAAMIYPLYAGHISVEPVFEEKMLEFDLKLRGRIRIFTVGLPLLMTYKSKDLKYLRKKVKKALK